MISSLRRLTAMAAVEEGPVARLITQKLKDRFKVRGETREITIAKHSLYWNFGSLVSVLVTTRD